MPPAAGTAWLWPWHAGHQCPFAAEIFRGKVPFSWPKGAVLQESGVEAGSYEPPRQWTPGILILVYDAGALALRRTPVGTVC